MDVYRNQFKRDYNRTSMTYSITKAELIALVSACQQRSYAEEVQLLQEKGEDVDWLMSALQTHSRDGISNDEEELKKRRQVFGTNQKEIKEPPGFIELFCEALEDFTMRILMTAAVLSIAL